MPTEVNGGRASLPLSDRQRRFVTEYMTNGANASKAASAAGYGLTSARQSGARLLALPQVRAAIERLRVEQLDELRERLGVTLERSLCAVACAAFADPRKLFDEHGAPIPVKDLDDDTAMAIESIEVVEQYEGSGEERLFTGYVKKYKFARRSAAQDMLMKHLNGYKEHEKGKGDAAVNGVAALLEGMRRSALPVAPVVEDDHGV